MRVSTGIAIALILALMVALIPGGSAQAQAPLDNPKQGVVSAGTGNPYARAAQLPARIIQFIAQPATINRDKR
jgi:hypothetical protein